MIGAPSFTSFIRLVHGIFGWMLWWISKHSAYVGVHQVLQLHFVLDEAFAGVVIEQDRGIALNKDNSTTTMCVNEHQHHKECHRMYPSLGLLNFHYFRVPLSHLYKYSYLILLHSSFSHIVIVYLERCTYSDYEKRLVMSDDQTKKNKESENITLIRWYYVMLLWNSCSILSLLGLHEIRLRVFFFFF